MKAQITSRIAIISDTHSSLAPQIIHLIEQCDIVVHAGDIGCKAVLDSINPKGARIIAVCGNNDSASLWAANEAHVVNKIPKIAELNLPGGDLVVEHGHLHGFHAPCHDMLRKAHPHARAIVYGHTHKQIIDDVTDPWVLNPGAAGNTRNHGGASCFVLMASQTEWKIEKFKFT